MAAYHVSSAGTGVQPYNSFATAARSLDELINSYLLAPGGGGPGGPGWVDGDIVCVLNTHDCAYNKNVTLTFPQTFAVPILCVDSGLNLQPTVGSTSFAKEYTSNSGGAWSIDLNGMAVLYGIHITTGKNSTSTTQLRIGQGTGTDSMMRFNNCLLEVGNTNPSVFSRIAIGIRTSSPNAQNFDFLNTGFRYNNAGQITSLDGGLISLIGCKTSGGTTPNSVFEVGSAFVEFNGGAYTYNTALLSLANDDPAHVRGKNVYLSGAVTTGTISSTTALGGPVIDFTGYSSAANTYGDFYQTVQGKVVAQTSKYLTASTGQSNGDGSNVKPALQMTSVAGSQQVNKYFPLYTKWMAAHVLATGSKTVAIKVAYDRATVLNNTDLWMEVASMSGSAQDTSPDVAIDYTYPTRSNAIRLADSVQINVRDFIGATPTALTDTADTWTGTFTNKKTHTLSKTITIDQQGYLFVRIALAVPGMDVYVAPDITVS